MKISTTLIAFLLILSRPIHSHSPDIEKTEPSTIHASDALRFGKLWPIIRQQTASGELDALIALRRSEIAAIKEKWRPWITQRTQLNGAWHERAAEFQRVLAEGKLVPSSQGCGGAYLLLDAKNNKRYIVKPLDEDMLCLNNRKRRASPFRDGLYRVRNYIPLYETPNREIASAETASLLGIPESTPWAILMIVTSEIFYDISESLAEENRPHFLARTSPCDKEKLCSIQPFIPDTIDLGEAIHEWFEAKQTETILPIDQTSFENANLLVWMTYDCDGHGSNFLLFLDTIDEQGKAVYGLKKIDNGLSFPVINKYLVNYLACLPNAKFPISPALRDKIARIDSEAIVQMLRTYELEDALSAFATRLKVIKALAEREMTIEEMNFRMEFLSHPRGEELALSTYSREELEAFALQKDRIIPTLEETQSLRSLLQQ